MNFIQRYLRRALLSESELAALQEKPNSHSNITKDTTMELISCGPTLSNIASQVSLSSLPEVNRLVVQTSIQGLFTKKHFDICMVRSILEVVGVSENTPAFKQLHALHCIHYQDMPQELLDILPSLLNECMLGKRGKCVAAETALQGVKF